MSDLERYASAGILVATRLSGLMVFAPLFSSPAMAPRIKAGFVLALTILLAPVVCCMEGARIAVDVRGVLGELSVGLLFGLCLMMLSESLLMAGTLLGMSFSFSLVNLLDPNTMVETPVLGQMLGLMGVLIIIGAGLDRVLLSAMVTSFRLAPVGSAMLHVESSKVIAQMAGGIFLSGLQLAAPVMSAALAVETTISMVSRLAPMLPVQVVGVPLKTIASYVVLIGSLAIWPGWVERHFAVLLTAAGKLMVGA